MKRARDKSWDNESHSLLDPYPNNAAKTGQDAGRTSLQCRFGKKEHRSNQIQCDGSPNPWNKSIATMASKEQIVGRSQMTASRVEHSEYLARKHDQVDGHCHTDDLNQQSRRCWRCGVTSRYSKNPHYENDERGAANEGRSQESWGKQRGVPKWTAAKSTIKKCSYRMDTDGPSNRQHYERNIPSWIWLLPQKPHVEQITNNV